jgi:PTH1 family peptidyl-tRNA hydrolase
VWLIVGLGNPGPRYERHRHNIGFRVAEELARRHRIAESGFRDKHGGQLATGSIDWPGGGTRVVILKPMEYMNLSGHAVQRTAAFHKVDPSHMVVVHDEVDFPFGRIKVKPDGGHGGHNGVRSIIQQLGADGFARVRVGVGRPDRERGPEVADYVLSDFPPSMDRDVEELTGRAADAVETIVRDGVRKAMNVHNADPKAGAPEASDD